MTSLLDRLPSGSSVLVDSAPIIYVLEGSPHAARFEPLFAAADEGRYELVVTPVTLVEVVAGPLRQKNEALANRYVGALTHPPFRLREMDEQIAVTAARLRIQYRLKLPDAIQLATALHERLPGDRDARSRLLGDHRHPRADGLTQPAALNSATAPAAHRALRAGAARAAATASR